MIMKEKDKPDFEQRALASSAVSIIEEGATSFIDPEEIDLLNDLEFMKDLEESDWEIANGKTKKWKDFKKL